MAVIHDTTMSPSKLELLKAWLPTQPWYVDTGRGPDLRTAGGFRLDDPAGEVGIEFMVVTDGPRGEVTYLVPMAYRGNAVPTAAGWLIGTSEHGVLGRRWIYDGPGDPVLAAQLVALIQGQAVPQAQNVSTTPDPTVIGRPPADIVLTAAGSDVTSNGPSGTDLRVHAVGADGAPAGQLLVRINRILHPADCTSAAGAVESADDGGQPCLSATWRRVGRTWARGVLATARYLPEPTTTS